MLVEEIPKSVNPNTSIVYFSSSINLTARPTARQQNEESNTKRAKVNYNVNLLMNAQTSANDQVDTGPLKSVQQIQLERIISKRFLELNKEPPFELPKNFTYNVHGKKKTIGNTPTTKKILSARRNLNSYFEEERNLISINTILGLNFQFIEIESKKDKPAKRIKPKVKLCCMCGENSSYARCGSCGLFCCSVGCNNLHNELRCT